MTDYTTIRVSKAAKESAQEAKRDGETWNDYIQRCTDTPPSVTEFVPVEDVTGVLSDFSDMPEQEPVDLEKVLDGIPEYDLQDRLDRIEAALGDSRNLVQLEATEYRKIADEVEGRLR